VILLKAKVLKIEYLAQFCILTRKQEESFITKANNLGELIEELSIKYPLFKKYALDDATNDLNDQIRVVIAKEGFLAADALSLGNRDAAIEHGMSITFW
jgi:molybdopterin converting factor small subunit